MENSALVLSVSLNDWLLILMLEKGFFFFTRFYAVGYLLQPQHSIREIKYQIIYFQHIIARNTDFKTFFLVSTDSTKHLHAVDLP